MTDKEKARAYDEAIGKAQNILHTSEFIKITDLFPDLAESEDERIKKALIDALKTSKSVGELKFVLPEPTRKDCIAYLEKQKETGIRWFKSDNVKNPDKPYIDKAGMFYTTDGRMCYASEIEKQKRETLRDFVDDFPYRVEQKEQKPTKKHDLVAQLREHLANTPKEQLEAEWKELEEWNHVGPTVEEYLGRIKSAEWTLPKDFEEAVYKVANFISPFDNQEELRKVSHHFAEQLLSLAKKELDEPAEWGKTTINGEPIPTENQSIDIPLAEWSEEDEETLACAISVFEDFAECKNVSVPPASAKRYLKRLKSLRPQPKQEWSEEDDDFINMLILHFNYLINKGGDSVETYKSYREKLKTLRPSWKPSEQEKGALRTAIYVLTEERNFPKAAANLQAILDAFDGKETRKEWKPSEEQMRILDIVISDYRHACTKGSDNKAEILKSILERLKKL